MLKLISPQSPHVAGPGVTLTSDTLGMDVKLSLPQYMAALQWLYTGMNPPRITAPMTWNTSAGEWRFYYSQYMLPGSCPFIGFVINIPGSVNSAVSGQRYVLEAYASRSASKGAIMAQEWRSDSATGSVRFGSILCASEGRIAYPFPAWAGQSSKTVPPWYDGGYYFTNNLVNSGGTIYAALSSGISTTEPSADPGRWSVYGGSLPDANDDSLSLRPPGYPTPATPPAADPTVTILTPGALDLVNIFGDEVARLLAERTTVPANDN